MRRSVFLLLVFVVQFAYAQDGFTLRTGDLLFQVGRSGAFNDAIVASTGANADIQYTHVGMVLVEDSVIYVLEATMPFVAKTPLEEYLKRSEQKDGKPVISVGRLRPCYYGSIKGAVKKMESLIGKPYDYVFDPFNDAYYCSEIIYISFIAWDGSYVFDSHPMTFVDRSTGEIAEGWVAHFKRHKVEVPEGVYGTNPADMSRSNAIEIIYHYFE